MRFEEALQAMREGKRIIKKDLPVYKYDIVDGKIWKEYPDFLDNIIYMPNAAFPCSDILSEDWEVVEDELQF